MQSRKLGEILVELGLIDEAGLQRALDIQAREGGTLGRIVSGLGLADEQQVSHAIADWYRLEHFVKSEIAPSMANVLTAEFCRRRLVAPMSTEQGKLRLAMADPLDIVTIQDIEFRANLKVVPVVATESAIADILDHLHPATGQANDILHLADDPSIAAEMEAVAEVEDGVNIIQLTKDSELPQTVRLVYGVLASAVKEGASDIHMEPGDRGIQVRYRIDGLLRNVAQIPHSLQDATISRIKILSGMDIAERRKPQDGRSQLRSDGRRIDLRVSTVPTEYGEKVVLRLLDSSKAQIAMDDLGLAPENLNRLQTLLSRPTGMLLVTGPTGSGKTSTLYAALNWLKSPTKNILTIEDPIEYHLPGINQVQIHVKAGVTFASALRSFLRQDPNVILVGEIRDKETASIALEASQTGHLLLSTLHTNDAAATITRLVELGMEPFLVGSSIIGILAQRLVRRICPDCAVDTPPAEATVQRLGGAHWLPGDGVWRTGRGCPTCRQLGYKGRLAIHELLEVTQDVRDLICRRAPDHAIRQAARHAGMRLLLEDGVAKAAAGLTTLEEVLRVAPLSDSTPAEPPARLDASAGVAPAAPQAPPSREAPAPTRVLVVDDSATIVEVLKYYLALEGYDVLVARDGASGLDLARRALPDAVISDVEMPEMDGTALVRALRDDPMTRDLPIMLLTSKTGVDSEADGLGAGADDYVPKPVDPRRLAARVKALLARRRQPRLVAR